MIPNQLLNSKCFNTKDVISQNEWSELEGKSPQENAEDLYCEDDNKFGQFPCDPVLFLFLNDESKDVITKAHCGIRSTIVKSMESVDRVYLWKWNGQNITRTYLKLLFPYYKFPLLSIHIDGNGLYHLKNSQTFLFAVRSIGIKNVGTAGEYENAYVSAIHDQDIEIYTLIPIQDTSKFMTNTLTVSDIPEVKDDDTSPIYTDIVIQAEYVNYINRTTRTQYDMDIVRFLELIHKDIYTANKLEILIKHTYTLGYAINNIPDTVSQNSFLRYLLFWGDKLWGIRLKDIRIKTMLNPKHLHASDFFFGKIPFVPLQQLTDRTKQTVKLLFNSTSPPNTITTILTKDFQIGRFITYDKYRIFTISGEIDESNKLNKTGFDIMLQKLWDNIDTIQIYNDRFNFLLPVIDSMRYTITPITFEQTYPYIVVGEDDFKTTYVKVFKGNVQFNIHGASPVNLPLLTNKLIFDITTSELINLKYSVLIKSGDDPIKYIYLGYSRLVYEFQMDSEIVDYGEDYGESTNQTVVVSRDIIYFLNFKEYISKADAPELVDIIRAEVKFNARKIVDVYLNNYNRSGKRLKTKVLYPKRN